MLPRMKSHLLAIAIAGLVSALPAQALELPEGESGFAPKPLVKAKAHMIVAAHPLAAEAGLEMLRKGGAAIDAGVAAQMVLTLPDNLVKLSCLPIRNMLACGFQLFQR